jgi:cell division protein FtsZ
MTMSEFEKNTAENNKRNITVIGMGRAGVRSADMLAKIMPGSTAICLCDTDKNSLEHASATEAAKYLLDNEWRGGTGTGGNFTNAQRSMARERPKLEEMVTGSDYLVVLSGFGGGTGTAGAVALAGIARRLQIPAVFIITLPFSLEGSAKQRIAENNWRDLSDMADAVVALPNDLLFSVISADAPIAEAFVRADEELARVALGIIDILKGDSLLSADFAVLTEILKNRKSYCGIGVGRVQRSGELNPGLLAVEKMINSVVSVEIN